LSGVEAEDMSTGKIPSWESELWSYVGSGDGRHCPLIVQCEIERSYLCPDDAWKHFHQLVEKSQFEIDRVDLGGVQFEGVESCRVLHLVERLAQKYVEMGGIDSPPVPTVLIGLFDRRCPVEVRLVPLTTYHGAIWLLNGNWVIQLNKNDTLSWQRHSLFHEAFHILAHRKCSPVFRKRGSGEGSFNELLAEHFAICTLMPRGLVTEKWAEVKDLGRMMEIFDAPKLAMVARLRGLRLI